MQSTKEISAIVKDELSKKGLELYDIKLEFGRSNGEIVLMDEISGGNMRAYKAGINIKPLEIEKILLS